MESIYKKPNEVIVDQAKLYLSGMSFRKIAEIYRISHVTVRDNLLVKLKKISPSLRGADADLYDQVVAASKGNQAKKIDDAEIQSRILQAYDLLVNENLPVKEIAKRLNTTEFIIYRDLTKRLEMLNKLNASLVTPQMLETAAAVLSKHSNDNLIKVQSETMQVPPFTIDINRLYKVGEKQVNFLFDLALTFRIKPEVLAPIVNMDTATLLNLFATYKSKTKHALDYLINYDLTNQAEAVQRLQQFYQNLCDAINQKDKAKMQALLEEITDHKAMRLYNEKKKRNYTYTDENLRVIINFQLKYALPTDYVVSKFQTAKGWYQDKVKALIGEDFELYNRYQSINDAWDDPKYRMRVSQ